MYFFENEENRVRLKEIIDSWAGTPHKHHCGVKQMGTDCIYFVVRAMEEIGVLHNIQIPEYAKDWHLHRSDEKLRQRFVEHPRFEEVGTNDPMDGDVLLFQYGRAASHAAIYFNGYIWHSLTGMRVEPRRYRDKEFYKRMRFGFRVLA